MILKSLRRKRVVITGRVEGYTRRELVTLVERRGGVVDAGVSRSTDVLVRGVSTRWLYRTHGTKEAYAAELVRAGFPIVMVYEDAFRRLVEARRGVRTAEHIAGKRVAWLAKPERADDADRAAAIAGPTDRLSERFQRAEQSRLRKLLFRGRDPSVCDVCGRRFPVEFLVAAHIKPRSQCSGRERRDAENIVFAACLFGCDAFYEKGLVTVSSSGRIMTVPAATTTGPVRAALRAVRGRACPRWDDGTSEYFEWHRERCFVGA